MAWEGPRQNHYQITKEPIGVVAVAEGQIATLPLVIVKGEEPTILWLNQIRFNWSKIHYTTNPGPHELLTNYSEAFQEGLQSFK